MEMETSDTSEQKPDRGSSWLRELYEYFAPVREEALEKGHTEDEINTVIDEAVRAVRAEQAMKNAQKNDS